MGKDKAKENPTDQPKNKTEKKPDVLDTNDAKVAEKGKEIAGEKTVVKKETTKEASEIKREVLQQEINLDKDTASKIDKLDVDGNLDTKEQQEGFAMLQGVAISGLLADIFKQGIPKESLKSLENIRSLGSGVTDKLSNSIEKNSLKKIQDIASKKGSDLYAALQQNWEKLVDRAYEIYDGAKKAKDTLERKTSAPQEGQTNGEKPAEGLSDKIVDFAKNHPILTAGIAAAGAYGVYRIYKWFSSDDDEAAEGEKKPGFIDSILGDKWGKRLKYGLGIGLGIFVLGKLIGSEDIGKWIKDKIGIDITGNRLSQFLVLLSQGQIVEAFKVLFEGPDQNFSIHQSMAEKISKETGVDVKPETLKKIGSMKYEEFTSALAQGKNAISGLMSQLGSLLGNIPIIGTAIFGNPDEVKEEDAIRKYFESHQAEIDKMKGPNTTIDQVLSSLSGIEGGGNIEAPQPSAESSAIDDAINKIEDPDKKAIAKEMNAEIQQKLTPEKTVLEMIAVATKNKVKTEDLQKALILRKKIFREYLEILSTGDLEKIATKAGELTDADNALQTEMKNVGDEINKRHGWGPGLEELGLTHAMKFYRFYRQPAFKKAYGAYLLSEVVKKPYKLAKKGIDKIRGNVNEEIIGREFKPNATVEEVEKDLARVTDEAADAKKIREAAEAQKVNPMKTQDQITSEVNNAATKEKLLNHDLEINKERLKTAKLETELSELKKVGTDTTKIAATENLLKENKDRLRTLMNERLPLQGEYLTQEITKATKTFEKEIGTDGKKVLTKGYLEQMDQIQNQVEAHSNQLVERRNQLLKDAETAEKAGRSTEVKTIAKEFNQLSEELVRLQIKSIDSGDKLAQKWFKSWNLFKELNGGTLTGEASEVMQAEKNQLQRTLSNVISGQKEANSMKSHVIKSIKWKIGINAVFMGLGLAVNLADNKEGKDYGKIIKQTAADTLPFISTYSDLYTATTGRELVTDRKVDATDRALRGVFGAGSALCDATEFAGAAMTLRKAGGAWKEAKAAGKTLELAEIMKTMKAEKRETENIEALREMSQTGHWAIKMGMAGALGIAGYSVISSMMSGPELSPETREIMGDQIQNIDVAPPPSAE